MRDEPDISHEALRSCLREQYGLDVTSIFFVPLGLDTNAGIFRVESDTAATDAMKIKRGAFYPSSCLVPRYLYDEGITSIVAPVPTKNGALWTKAEGWTVIVYPYIEGQSGWTGITDHHWTEAGRVFKQVHSVSPPEPPPEGIRTESFNPPYVRMVDRIETALTDVADRQAPSHQALRSSWMKHQQSIRAMLTSLERLAGVLRSREFPYVVCHADLHPGNLLRTQDGSVFVVDWDDVMLAPRERDFIFVGEPDAGSPFFRGYGQVEIDWTALTYYRYERVVTDLIEDSEQVLFRDDLSEEAKDGAVGRFNGYLTSRNLAAAKLAAAHIPEDFRPR
jgi:spectinomycin phosphotransferase